MRATWVLAVALFAAASLHAQTVRDGVYTTAQAARGKATYTLRCALCHGEMLEGQAGPPLVGDIFLGPRDKQPVFELFDKIHATMPADAPGSLTPQEAVDIVAFILQENKFPAGPAELGTSDAALKRMTLETTTPAPAGAATTPGATFPVTGTVNQVMRGILFPSSNVLFDVQTKDPAAGAKGGTARGDATTTTSRYGDVYAPWLVVDAAAVSIADIGPVLMQPRRCDNGKPAPVDRDDWKEYVQGLVEAGRAAYRASQSRNQEAVSEATNTISDACANCHRVYRDVPTAAMRCTPH